MLSSEMAHSELLLRRHREACTISDTVNVQHLPEPQDPRWQDDCDLGLAMLAVLHLMIVLLIHMAAAADVVHLVIGALNMEPSENGSLDNPQMLGFVEFMSFTNQFKCVGRFLHSSECQLPA